MLKTNILNNNNVPAFHIKTFCHIEIYIKRLTIWLWLRNQRICKYLNCARVNVEQNFNKVSKGNGRVCVLSDLFVLEIHPILSFEIIGLFTLLCMADGGCLSDGSDSEFLIRLVLTIVLVLSSTTYPVVMQGLNLDLCS